MQYTSILLAVACSGAAVAPAVAVRAGVPAAAPAVAAVPFAAPMAVVAAPVVAASVVATLARREVVLAPDTDIIVNLIAPMSSKTARTGDRFKFSTGSDVTQDGFVVIPRGTQGTGMVASSSDTGMMGASGKLDLAFNALDLNGRRIALTGADRQDGKGNPARWSGPRSLSGFSRCW